MSSWIGLVVLGFAVHWMISMTLRGRENSQSDFVMALSIFASVMIVMGIVGPAVPYVGLFTAGLGLLIVKAVLLMAVFRFRENERLSTIWTIGAVMEKRIPLTAVLNAVGCERYDESGRRCQNLAKQLESGTPLDQSLQLAGYPLPTEAALAVQFSDNRQQAGRLLKDAARHAVNGTPEVNAIIQQLTYIVFLTIFGSCVTTFLVLRILPTLRVVFRDFNTDLPAFSQWTFDVAASLVPFAFLLVPLNIVLFLAILLMAAHYVGRIRWEPWFVQRWTNTYHSAVIQRNLASQVRYRVPISHAVEQLAKRYPRQHIRDRLRRASHGMSAGADWCDVLTRERLLTAPVAQVLKSAHRLGNLDWALQEMADATFRRTRARLTSILRITMPLIVIAFGIPVGILAVATVLPLSEMIMNLS